MAAEPGIRSGYKLAAAVNDSDEPVFVHERRFMHIANI